MNDAELNDILCSGEECDVTHCNRNAASPARTCLDQVLLARARLVQWRKHMHTIYAHKQHMQTTAANLQLPARTAAPAALERSSNKCACLTSTTSKNLVTTQQKEMCKPQFYFSLPSYAAILFWGASQLLKVERQVLTIEYCPRLADGIPHAPYFIRSQNLAEDCTAHAECICSFLFFGGPLYHL